jgi:hypothetical protein
VAIPSQAPDVAPFLAARIPAGWLRYILGALSQLRMPATWVYATNADLDQVMLWVDYLICTMSEAVNYMESGTLSLTIAAGATQASATVTFPTAFDVAPDVVVSTDTGLVGVGASLLTSTTFLATITRPVALVTTDTAVVTWQAQVAS